MKRVICFVASMILILPAWPAKKITVAELAEILRSMHEQKKSDQDVAATLEQVELGEQLTGSAMNDLTLYAPGPLTTEQMYVLEARSADLLPPSSDLPSIAAPGKAAQEAILARAGNYITKTYDQLPPLGATKTTLRFQDNTSAVSSSSGIHSSAQDAAAFSGFSTPNVFVHYINATAAAIVFEHGSEKKPAAKDLTRWGANGYMRIPEPVPSLGRIYKDVQAAGTLKWLRWELVSGKPAAVFSFEVPKQKSKLEVNVCCFPDIRQAGTARFYTAATARQMAGSEAAGSGGGVVGNFRTDTDWNEFKRTVQYGGKLFIDPDTGVILRLIIEPELKPSDLVHQLDTRIDYGAATAGVRTFLVPVKTVTNSIVVPNGDSGAGTYATRCTLFVSEYSAYRQLPGK